MTTPNILLVPQPFYNAINPQRLVEGRWRFYRSNIQTGLPEYMDVDEPEEFRQRTDGVSIRPIKSDGDWYWVVMGDTKVMVKRGV